MSLEVRRVKLLSGVARAGSAEILSRHVVRPSEEEIAEIVLPAAQTSRGAAQLIAR
jgi:hypothetical protein